jgi:DNA segregation ATPase FtsK/SpoIIIE, S-DNA-T family
VLIDWLKSAFSTLGHSIQVRAIHPGPVLVGFEIEFESAFSGAELNALIPDLATALLVNRVKMIEIAPNHFALELPNPNRQIIPLAQLFNSALWQQASVATLVVGQNSVGETVLLELNRVPHVIIAGVDAEECHTFLDTLLISLLVKNTPEYLRFILFSGEKQHLSDYHDIPHLLVPLIEDVATLLPILQWCVKEMERRYRLMAKHNVRNIERYNETWLQSQTEVPNDEGETAKEQDDFLPYLVIVIPEISELTLSPMNQSIEEPISQLTQKARAAGLHLIMATQFPSINVITGLLKANIPTRIALKVGPIKQNHVIFWDN